MARGSNNVETAFRFLRGLGLSPAQAAGAVGGLTGESGPNLDPSARNPTSGALGIGQWLGGRAKGVRSGDLQGQLQHLAAELEGPEHGALAALRRAKTPEQAAEVWTRTFERPSASEIASSLGARQTTARQIFNELRGVTGGSSAGGSAASQVMGASGATQDQSGSSSPSGIDPAQLVSLLTQQEQRPVIQSAGIQAPSFAAHASTPAGYAVPQGGGGPAPAPDVSPLLAAIAGSVSQSGPDLSSVGGAGQSGAAVLAGAGGGRVSPRAKPGDPVVSSKQSEGGLHDTAGLAGFPAHDFFAPPGTHAVAPVSGTVIKLSGHEPKEGPPQGPGGPLGWSTYIKGDDGRTYFLTHEGSRNVKVGQKVKQGQIIGTVANYDKYGRPSHIHMGVSG